LQHMPVRDFSVGALASLLILLLTSCTTDSGGNSHPPAAARLGASPSSVSTAEPSDRDGVLRRFGPPDRIVRTSTQEIWYYEEVNPDESPEETARRRAATTMPTTRPHSGVGALGTAFSGLAPGTLFEPSSTPVTTTRPVGAVEPARPAVLREITFDRSTKMVKRSRRADDPKRPLAVPDPIDLEGYRSR